MHLKPGLLRACSLFAVTVPLCACGGGGGTGGGTGPGTPSVFGFGPGPTSTIVVDELFPGPPHTLKDIELADADDDGSPDLGYAATTAWMHMYVVESMRGLGNGAFGAVDSTGPYVSGEPPLLAMGDVMGPGQQGFALSHLQSMAASTGVITTGVRTIGFRTLGGITSQVGGNDFATAYARALAVGDWNGDGTDDIGIADGQLGQVVTWLSIGESAIGQAVPTALPQGYSALGLTAGDWEGDGDDDLFVALFFAYVTFTGPLAGTAVPLPPNHLLIDPVTGDFDGDGQADVAGMLVDGSATLKLFFLRGLGNGTFASLVPTTLPPGITYGTTDIPHMHAGDLDGDGRTDLAFLVPAADRTYVFLGTATGEFSLFADVDLEGGGSDVLAIGDVDADGDLDLVVGDATTLVVRTLLNERL